MEKRQLEVCQTDPTDPICQGINSFKSLLSPLGPTQTTPETTRSFITSLPTGVDSSLFPEATSTNTQLVLTATETETVTPAATNTVANTDGGVTPLATASNTPGTQGNGGQQDRGGGSSSQVPVIIGVVISLTSLIVLGVGLWFFCVRRRRGLRQRRQRQRGTGYGDLSPFEAQAHRRRMSQYSFHVETTFASSSSGQRSPISSPRDKDSDSASPSPGASNNRSNGNTTTTTTIRVSAVAADQRYSFGPEPEEYYVAGIKRSSQAVETAQASRRIMAPTSRESNSDNESLDSPSQRKIVLPGSAPGVPASTKQSPPRPTTPKPILQTRSESTIITRNLTQEKRPLDLRKSYHPSSNQRAPAVVDRDEEARVPPTIAQVMTELVGRGTDSASRFVNGGVGLDDGGRIVRKYTVRKSPLAQNPFLHPEDDEADLAASIEASSLEKHGLKYPPTALRIVNPDPEISESEEVFEKEVEFQRVQIVDIPPRRDNKKSEARSASEAVAKGEPKVERRRVSAASDPRTWKRVSFADQ